MNPITEEEFREELPAWFGLAIRADETQDFDGVVHSISYRWLGEELYRVIWNWDVDSDPWMITERPRQAGRWGCWGVGETFEAAAKALATHTLRYPSLPNDEGFAARLADRIPPARLVVPHGGPEAGPPQAIAGTSVVLLTHDPVEIPPIWRSTITGAAIVPDIVRREGTCVDVYEYGKPPLRVPVVMHEWPTAAIDAPEVVRRLVAFGHREGALPLMVVLGPSPAEYRIRIQLTDAARVVVRSGTAVGLDVGAVTRLGY